MRCSRGVPVVLAMCIAVVLGTVGGTASCVHGQVLDRLRPDVTTAESLSDVQQEQIAEYIDGWADRLTADDAREVMEARQRLLEPLRGANSSDAFITHYSAHAAERLAPVLDAEQMVTRVNAMIVVARLESDDAMPLIERAMEDDAAAVRYWSVKAIQSLPFSNAESQELIDRLVEHIGQEQELQVVEQALLALVRLDHDDARRQGLTLLNDRIKLHVDQPGLSLQPEHSALSSVYRHLASASDPEDEELRQLARTALRYQDLASQQLADDAVGSEARDSYDAMLEISDAALRFAADDLGLGNMPTSIQRLIEQENWQAIQRIVEEWRRLLQDTPFNFPADEVTVAD